MVIFSLCSKITITEDMKSGGFYGTWIQVQNKFYTISFWTFKFRVVNNIVNKEEHTFIFPSQTLTGNIVWGSLI